MSEPMTKDEIDAIRAREDAATPGPWMPVARGDDLGFYGRGPISTSMEQASDDARFIAHARADAPRLLAEVERLRSTLRDFAENWDHDGDAHRYRTTCRACAASRALGVEP